MHKNLSLKATALLLMSALAKGQKEHQKPPDDQQDFEGGNFFATIIKVPTQPPGRKNCNVVTNFNP